MSRFSAVTMIVLALAVAIPLRAEETGPANPMLHTRGTPIVDADDRPVVLRGVLLEGWLMWNGTPRSVHGFNGLNSREWNLAESPTRTGLTGR